MTLVKRLCRWLFNGLAAVSLAVCLATIGFWPASYRYDTWLAHGDYGKTDCRYSVGYFDGSVVATKNAYLEFPPNPTPAWFQARRYHPISSRMGFIFVSREKVDIFSLNEVVYSRLTAVGVPCWLVVAVSGVSPAIWLARFRRARRRKYRQVHGLCPSCGYDLRATPDRSPECGTVQAGLGRSGHVGRDL